MKKNAWISLLVVLIAVKNIHAMEASWENSQNQSIETKMLPFPQLCFAKTSLQETVNEQPYGVELSPYTNSPSSHIYSPSAPDLYCSPNGYSEFSQYQTSENVLSNFPKVEQKSPYSSLPPWDPQEELQGEFQNHLRTNNFQQMVPYAQSPHATLSTVPYASNQQLSPQLVAMPEADYQRVMMCTSLLMNQNQELLKELQETKELVQTLLLKGEEQTEVLVRVEQGQEILTDELMTLKGALVKVSTELTDQKQSGVEKAYHWGKFLFNAGVSVATGATTYTLITPVLAFLPAVISPPLAVPMAIATFSGLKLFTKLV